MAQPLNASPIQIERHEFLDIEVHAAKDREAHTSLPLRMDRSFFPHTSDPLRCCVEMTIVFGGETEGKPSVYSGMLRIKGFFRIHEKYPAEKRQQLFAVTGSSILYGACREMLANLTARGTHGVVSLPSVSFMPPAPKKADPTGSRLAEPETPYRAKRSATAKRLAK
jgi:preprotein translocase subunit SecB